MKLIDYQVRIQGLGTKSGSISISMLKEITDALLKSTDRVLRLCVEGKSTKSGKTPEWLRRSIDFTITGLQTGSTIVQLEAPPLEQTIPELFTQKKLWQDNYIKPGDSALSLLSRSVSDAAAENRESDYFDSGVLDALLSFKAITADKTREISISSRSKTEDNFKISHREIKKIKQIKIATPKSNTIVISGFFNLIEHNKRRFQLTMGDDRTVNGVMDPSLINIENMRELWGKRVTIKGKANYKPSGSLRSIEAQLVRPFETGDEILQRVPTSQSRFHFAEEFLSETSSNNALKKIWGKWPGDESIDDLLAALNQKPTSF